MEKYGFPHKREYSKIHRAWLQQDDDGSEGQSWRSYTSPRATCPILALWLGVVCSSMTINGLDHAVSIAEERKQVDSKPETSQNCDALGRVFDAPHQETPHVSHAYKLRDSSR